MYVCVLNYYGTKDVYKPDGGNFASSVDFKGKILIYRERTVILIYNMFSTFDYLTTVHLIIQSILFFPV